MAASLVIQNGKTFLEKRRTIFLGISPGNPYFYNLENLQRLFKFARNNSEKVFLFVPDIISVHNYRAVGYKNPERSERVKTNALRNKCNKAIEETGLHSISCCFVNWMEEVEISREYQKSLDYVRNLYQTSDQFRADIRDRTEAALKSFSNSREKGGDNKKSTDGKVVLNLEEGIQYLLKEIAFFPAIPYIYEDCQEFVFVYHRLSVMEKFFNGCYDGTVRPYFSYFVFEH